MLRDIEDSGEIFEPKTVETSYTINCTSTFAYMFAIDLERNYIVWLNLSSSNNSTIAGTTDFVHMMDYINICDTINVKEFFSMTAEQVVDNPQDADIIVSDNIRKL